MQQQIKMSDLVLPSGERLHWAATSEAPGPGGQGSKLCRPPGLRAQLNEARIHVASAAPSLRPGPGVPTEWDLAAGCVGTSPPATQKERPLFKAPPPPGQRRPLRRQEAARHETTAATGGKKQERTQVLNAIGRRK